MNITTEERGKYIMIYKDEKPLESIHTKQTVELYGSVENYLEKLENDLLTGKYWE